MPQLPIIIPIIVVGGLIGSLLKAKKQKIPRKKILSWSIIAGLFNAAFAYAELILTPQQTTFRNTSFVSPTSPIAFTASSFLAGLLIVLTVFGIAAVYLRVRKGDSESEGEEEPELTERESSKLKPG
jgi:hypothetical protein